VPIVQIQRDIAKNLDDKKHTLVYSSDLSAAFDLLRKKTFFHTLKGVLDKDIMNIIVDFLSERKMQVQIEGISFTLRNVDYGCEQGSVLVPRLFNLYMRNVTQHALGNATTTYA